MCMREKSGLVPYGPVPPKPDGIAQGQSSGRYRFRIVVEKNGAPERIRTSDPPPVRDTRYQEGSERIPARR